MTPRNVLMGHYGPFSPSPLPVKPNPACSPSYPIAHLLLEPRKQNERLGYRSVGGHEHTLEEIPKDDLFLY